MGERRRKTDRLTLNWVSPLPPARSGIADYSHKLRPALEAAADVTYISDNADQERGIWPLTAPPLVLNRAEHTIFHIGNNAAIHKAIWELSTAKKGIVILHDTRLQHLFAQIFLHETGDENIYLDLLERFYGREGREAGMAFRQNRLSLNELSVVAPMTELACMNSCGVVTHSSSESGRLNRLSIPYRQLNLPHPAKRIESRAPRDAREEIRLVVFGFISENRCLEQIMAALGGNLGKEDFRLFIAGTVGADVDLESLTVRHGLTGCVENLGFVDEPELDALLQSADLVFNLRYPTMGEASSAQLRIWANGAPSVVTSEGWYREIPDAAALRVAAGREVTELNGILAALRADRSAFESVGHAGYEHLVKHHSPERYVDGLIDLCGASRGAHARFDDFHFVDRLRRKAAAVMGNSASRGLFPGLERVLSNVPNADYSVPSDRAGDEIE